MRNFKNTSPVPSPISQTVVYEEEISHCAAGVRWLRFLHNQAHDGHTWPSERVAEGVAPTLTAATPAWVREARQHETVEGWFHALIRAHFHGPLKPPFNDEARARAGFGREWYWPLAESAEEAPAKG